MACKALAGTFPADSEAASSLASFPSRADLFSRGDSSELSKPDAAIDEKNIMKENEYSPSPKLFAA